MVVKEELKKLGLHFIVVDLGEIDIMETINAEQREQLKTGLKESGLELMDDSKGACYVRVLPPPSAPRTHTVRLPPLCHP